MVDLDEFTQTNGKKRAAVIGVALLILVVGLFFLLTSTPGKSIKSKYVKVCVKDTDGNPLPNVYVSSGTLSSRTSREGCVMMKKTDKLKASLTWFEPYRGPFRESIVLKPRFPEVSVEIAGTSNAVVEIREENKTVLQLESGDRFYLVPLRALEGGKRVYCQVSGNVCSNLKAVLVMDGKDVVEKNIPASREARSVKLLFTYTREKTVRLSPATHRITVKVVTKVGYDDILLSLKGETSITQSGKPPITLEIPAGDYNLEVYLRKEGKAIMVARKHIEILRDDVVTVSEFRPLHSRNVEVNSSIDGEVHVLLDGSEIYKVDVKAGSPLTIQAPEDATLLFISKDKRSQVRRVADSVFFDPPQKVEFTVKVTKGDDPVPGASIRFNVGPVTVYYAITDLQGEAKVLVSPSHYKVCASADGLRTCKDVKVRKGGSTTINLLRLARKIKISSGGTPLEGYIIVGGLKLPVIGGEAVIPDIKEGLVAVETNEGRFLLNMSEGNSMDLKVGRFTDAEATLLLMGPVGTLYTVLSPSGEEIISGRLTSPLTRVSLPPGTYEVTLSNGETTVTKVVTVGDGDYTKVEINTPTTTYPLQINVVSDYPAELSIYRGLKAVYRDSIKGSVTVDLAEGVYVVKVWLGGTKETKIVTVPEDQNITFVLIDPKPSVKMKVVTDDGRMVKRARKGGSYYLLVKAFSKLPYTLHLITKRATVESNQLKSEGGPLEARIPLRVEENAEITAVLYTPKGSTTAMVEVPTGDIELLCSSGICLGSAVKGSKYVWEALKERKEKVDYLVTGDRLVADVRNLDHYTGSEDITSFLNSLEAVHRFYVKDNLISEYRDPLAGLVNLPKHGRIVLSNSTVPPVANAVVRGEFVSASSFPDATLVVKGDGCSPSYNVSKGEVVKRATSDGYEFVQPFSIYLDATGCESLTVVAYSTEGGIAPTSATVRVEESSLSVWVSPQQLGVDDNLFTVKVKNSLDTSLDVSLSMDNDNPNCSLNLTYEPQRFTLPPSGEMELNVSVDGCKNHEGNIVVTASALNYQGLTTERFVRYRFWNACLLLESNVSVVQEGEAPFTLLNTCDYRLSDLSCGDWDCPTEVPAHGEFTAQKDVESSAREQLRISYLDGYGYRRTESFTVVYYVVGKDSYLDFSGTRNLATTYEDPSSFIEVTPVNVPPGLEVNNDSFQASLYFDWKSCIEDHYNPRDPKQATDTCNHLKSLADAVASKLTLAWAPYGDEFILYVEMVDLTHPNPFETNEEVQEALNYLELVASLEVKDDNGNTFHLLGEEPVTWSPSLRIISTARKDENTISLELSTSYSRPFSVVYNIQASTSDGSANLRCGGWKSSCLLEGELSGSELSLSIPYALGASPYNVNLTLTLGDGTTKRWTFSISETDDIGYPPVPPTPPSDSINDGVSLEDCRPFYYVPSKYLALGDETAIDNYVENVVEGSQPPFLLFDEKALRAAKNYMEKTYGVVEDLTQLLEVNVNGVPCVEKGDLQRALQERNHEAIASMLNCCEKAGFLSRCKYLIDKVKPYILFPAVVVSNDGVYRAYVDLSADNPEILFKEENLEGLKPFANHYKEWKNLVEGIYDVSGEAPIVLDNSVAVAYLFPFESNCKVGSDENYIYTPPGKGYAFSDKKNVRLTVMPVADSCTFKNLVTGESYEVNEEKSISLTAPVTPERVRIGVREGTARLCYKEDGGFKLFIDPTSVQDIVAGEEKVNQVCLIVENDVLGCYDLNVEVPVGSCALPNLGNVVLGGEERGNAILLSNGQITLLLGSAAEAIFGVGSDSYLPVLCIDGNLYLFSDPDSYLQTLQEVYTFNPTKIKDLLIYGYPEITEIGNHSVVYQPGSLENVEDCEVDESCLQGCVETCWNEETDLESDWRTIAQCMNTCRQNCMGNCNAVKKCERLNDIAGGQYFFWTETLKDDGIVGHCEVEAEGCRYDLSHVTNGPSSGRVGDGGIVFKLNEGNYYVSSGVETVGYYDEKYTCAFDGIHYLWDSRFGNSPAEYQVYLGDSLVGYLLVPKNIINNRCSYEELNIPDDAIMILPDGNAHTTSVSDYLQEEYTIREGSSIIWHDTSRRYRVVVDGLQGSGPYWKSVDLSGSGGTVLPVPGGYVEAFDKDGREVNFITFTFLNNGYIVTDSDPVYIYGEEEPNEFRDVEVGNVESLNVSGYLAPISGVMLVLAEYTVNNPTFGTEDWNCVQYICTLKNAEGEWRPAIVAFKDGEPRKNVPYIRLPTDLLSNSTLCSNALPIDFYLCYKPVVEWDDLKPQPTTSYIESSVDAEGVSVPISYLTVSVNGNFRLKRLDVTEIIKDPSGLEGGDIILEWQQENNIIPIFRVPLKYLSGEYASEYTDVSIHSTYYHPLDPEESRAESWNYERFSPGNTIPFCLSISSDALVGDYKNPEWLLGPPSKPLPFFIVDEDLGEDDDPATFGYVDKNGEVVVVWSTTVSDKGSDIDLTTFLGLGGGGYAEQDKCS